MCWIKERGGGAGKGLVDEGGARGEARAHGRPFIEERRSCTSAMIKRGTRRDVGLEADPREARRSQWIDKNGREEVMEEGVDPRERRGSQWSTRTGRRK